MSARSVWRREQKWATLGIGMKRNAVDTNVGIDSELYDQLGKATLAAIGLNTEPVKRKCRKKKQSSFEGDEVEPTSGICGDCRPSQTLAAVKNQ